MEAQSLPPTGRLFLPRSPKVLGAFSDERLVEQVRRGNEDAFEAIYDRHHRGILTFCRHMLSSPDEAEDAVQQTFISAYDAMRVDAREIRLKPWLYAIARNRCLSILRARREQPAELDDMPTAGLSEEVQQRADLRELLRDLHELPVDQRAALVLSEVGGLSHAEVGTIVGCEVAKVKSLVFQARSSLIETRKARDIPCHEIREQLATATGGALRRGPLRRHLRTCEGCAEFRDDVARQRRALAAILPVVPTVGLKSSLLASIGLGGGGGGGAAVGGGLGGGIASFASSGAAVKAVSVVALAGLAVGGGVVLDRGSSPKPAEAADGAAGGGQAWPAPPAGSGPGARKLALARDPAGASHGPSSATPAARRIAKHGAPGRHRAHHPNANGGAQQRGSHGGGSSGGGSAPTAPAPSADSSTPSTSGGGNRGHHGNGDSGRHLGWTQAHAQHPPPVPAPHPHPQPQPPPPRADSREDQGRSDSHGKPDKEAEAGTAVASAGEE